MFRRILPMLLLVLIITSFAGFSSHEGEKSVPLTQDGTGESAEDIYAKRVVLFYKVFDCSIDELLWQTTNEVVGVWMALAPIRIELQLESQSCEGGRFGNGMSEIYWGANFDETDIIGGAYMSNINANNRVITEEDIVPNQLKLIELANEFNSTSPIVVYNAMIHLFGNAMGLADASNLYPDECWWSVMLSNCATSRNPPQDADLAALRHIYDIEPDPILDLGPGESYRIADFDTNGNQFIERSEFDPAIDLWASGDMTDEFFLELLGWFLRTRRIPVEEEPESAQISQGAVSIYDAKGILITRSGCIANSSQRLGNLMNFSNIPVGIYISKIQDCQTGRITVKLIAKLPN